MMCMLLRYVVFIIIVLLPTHVGGSTFMVLFIVFDVHMSSFMCFWKIEHMHRGGLLSVLLMLVKITQNRDNWKRPTNRLFFQHGFLWDKLNTDQLLLWTRTKYYSEHGPTSISLFQVSVKMGEFRDNFIISENSLFYQYASVGKFGSFVGQVEISHNSANLQASHSWYNMKLNTDQLLLWTRTKYYSEHGPTSISLFQVSVKMGEFRDNFIISENSLFYQYASVGKFGSFVGQVETSGKSANLQGRYFGVNISCCKRWF